MTTYNPNPVAGYFDGLIESTESPIEVRTPNPDGKSSPLYDVVNHYFEIDGVFYNVHPRRGDLGGYPVRMFSSFAPDGWPDVEFEKDCESLVSDGDAMIRAEARAVDQRNEERGGVLTRDDEAALAALVCDLSAVALAKALIEARGPNASIVDILKPAAPVLEKLSAEYMAPEQWTGEGCERDGTIPNCPGVGI